MLVSLKIRSQSGKLAASVLLAVGLLPAQPYARPPALEGVGIDQKLNYQVPLDLHFTDESGHSVRLGQYFNGKPVVLSLVYYRCPMLCNLVMNGELRAFRGLPLTIGKDFEVITVSFDPKETPGIAAAKKATYVDGYNRSGAAEGWHFLTGQQDQIRALADAVGFHYKWDPQTNQWAHASGIMLLTPQGRLARYQFGIEYSSKDLRLGLVEASNEKIGSPTDKILLFCFHYDPAKGKYTFAAMNALRAGGSATVLVLGAFLFINLRRERRQEGSQKA